MEGIQYFTSVNAYLLLKCQISKKGIFHLNILTNPSQWSIQGCQIPLACLHLSVKCYAGQVKVLKICVVRFLFTVSRKNWGHEGRVTYLEILHPCNNVLMTANISWSEYSSRSSLHSGTVLFAHVFPVWVFKCSHCRHQYLSDDQAALPNRFC